MIKAVIFDMDGVIVSTDELHFLSWERVSLEENIYFDRQINNKLLGVTRMDSVEIVLQQANRLYSKEEKENIAKRKNKYFLEMIEDFTKASILPGVEDNLLLLKQKGIKIALGTSSRNAEVILRKVGLRKYFDAISDGNHVHKSKPDPEVFLYAATLLNVPPEQCLVIEDSEVGIKAAKVAGMKTISVGYANCGDYNANTLLDINVAELLDL